MLFDKLEYTLSLFYEEIADYNRCNCFSRNMLRGSGSIAQ